MATITNAARAEIEREKNYTPEEILPFLQKRKNFLTVSVGIKRELRRLNYEGSDVELRGAFCTLMESAGVNSAKFKQENLWLDDKALPSSDSAIKMCFAFGLSGQAALDFLWKVCRVNGFNFRRASDVIYCYCLENGKSNEDAERLIQAYSKFADNLPKLSEDFTKSTNA